MADRLAYKDSDKTIWVTAEAQGTTVPQTERTDWVRPMQLRANQAVAGLKLIADSTGTLSALQLSNAVRALAAGLIALIRIQLDRSDID